MTSGPFRILILGDFGAREHRGLSDASTLGTRKARRVDRDDIDKVVAAMAPQLDLALEPGAPPIAIRVEQLDDFHPDWLVQHVGEFQQLRDLRTQIADPRNAPSASRPVSPPARPASSAAATAERLGDASVLDMILGNEEVAGTAAPRPRDELSDYVSQAVRKHAVPQRSTDQITLIKQVDDVIAATMRVVLHHPTFQSVEALWRGVSFLAWRLETDDMLQLWVADVTRQELAAAVSGSDDTAARGLKKLLRGEAGPGAWSLVLGGYTFTPNEIPTVAGLAATARETGVPWIAAAQATFAGIASFADSADPDDWDPSPIEAWEAFRRTPDAKWLSLALPRILMRVPYGARSSECEFPFEETHDGALSHEQFLWGTPAFVCGALLGQAAADGDEPPTQGTLDGLPLYIGTVDGLAAVTPCAEAVFAQRALIRLLDRGLTAIASEREGDSVRIPRLQSVASPPARLASPVSEDGQ